MPRPTGAHNRVKPTIKHAQLIAIVHDGLQAGKTIRAICRENTLPLATVYRLIAKGAIKYELKRKPMT
jgi:hypothetical protein